MLPDCPPFGRWFSGVNSSAAAKVTIALYRLAQGNFSNVKGVGEGVHEYKIDFGPGYRVYFGKDGDRVAILLGGSDKKGQAAAIAKAHGSSWESQHRKLFCGSACSAEDDRSSAQSESRMISPVIVALLYKPNVGSFQDGCGSCFASVSKMTAAAS